MYKWMNGTAAFAAVAMFLALTPVSARADHKLSEADERFVMKAAAGGTLEVDLGKLAQAHAANPDVKAFGEKMVTDHTKANERLIAIAKDEDVQLSHDLKGEQKQVYDKLAAVDGAEFDKSYMRHMVKDHEQDIADFNKEAADGQDPKVKQFAAQTVKVLDGHLALAKEVAAKIGAMPTGASVQRVTK